jgi:ABC-2 type transport system ATP-binding protein
VIEAHDLRRTYRTTTGVFRRRVIEVEAVRGISFEVAAGELFGLLGPNGAGKTSSVRSRILSSAATSTNPAAPTKSVGRGS